MRALDSTRQALLLACWCGQAAAVGLIGEPPRGEVPTAEEVARAEAEAKASMHFGPQLSSLFPGQPPVLVRSSPCREML